MTQATLFAEPDIAEFPENKTLPEFAANSGKLGQTQDRRVMTTEHRPDGFWIVNTPEGVCEMGPYPKLSEAQEDMEGVARMLRNEDRHSFFTVTR